MRRYHHSFLLDSSKGSVPKTCRIPRRLEEHVSELASRNNLTYTDVVIEALLHYLSLQIVERCNDDLRQNSKEIESAKRNDNLKEIKRLRFEQRRLELLKSELIEYFEDSTEKLLFGLREEKS